MISTMMLCRSSSRKLMAATASRRFSTIVRLGTEDPRMSQIVKHQGIVYTSGQVDLEAKDIKGQTQNVLRKIDNLLQLAKTSKANLLTATIWLKDMDKDFGAMNDVWCDWLDANQKPVRATVQADMARPSILVEIQVTAAEEKEGP